MIEVVMSNIFKRMPALTFWIAFAVSIINIIATIIGFNSLIKSFIPVPMNSILSSSIALIIMVFLVLFWINSLMSNSAGQLIYWINLFIAPFGYHVIGLPYWIGIILALSPYFIYFGITSFFERNRKHND